MEKWETWYPKGSERVSKSIGDLQRFEALEGNLFIAIEFATGAAHLQFQRVLAFRVHLEECVPEVWAKIHANSPVKWTFWEIRNSTWIAEREATGGLALYPKVRHFALVTEQKLIEILAPSEPIIG